MVLQSSFERSKGRLLVRTLGLAMNENNLDASNPILNKGGLKLEYSSYSNFTFYHIFEKKTALTHTHTRNKNKNKKEQREQL